MKLRVTWNINGSGPLIKWYSGPYWWWWLFWRWFDYSYWPDEKRRGRWASTAVDNIATDMAKQIEEEIDRDILGEIERSPK